MTNVKFVNYYNHLQKQKIIDYPFNLESDILPRVNDYIIWESQKFRVFEVEHKKEKINIVGIPHYFIQDFETTIEVKLVDHRILFHDRHLRNPFMTLLK